MRNLTLIALTSLIALSGCASDAYYAAHREQVLAWERVEVARAQERYRAMATYAKEGNSHAQVLAVAFLGNGVSDRPAPLPALRDPDEAAYRWASLIAPFAATAITGYYGAQVAITQSDNARMSAEYAYGAMSNIGTTGLGTTRDVAVAGFDAFRNLPPSSQTTNTYTVNAHDVAWGGSTLTNDSSRRCQGVWNNSNPGIQNPNFPFNC